MAGQGKLEYDLVIAPEAANAAVALTFDGATSLRLDRNDDLLINVAGGEFRQTIPEAYQLISGQKKQIKTSAAVSGNTVQITASIYDRHYPV
jgi:hypothetical protein